MCTISLKVLKCLAIEVTLVVNQFGLRNYKIYPELMMTTIYSQILQMQRITTPNAPSSC